MHISLTPELESRVKAKVESGLYNNASEVIREALRFMEGHEDSVREIKIARLKEQLRTGIDQLNRGEGIPIDSNTSLDRLFAAVGNPDLSALISCQGIAAYRRNVM